MFKPSDGKTTARGDQMVGDDLLACFVNDVAFFLYMLALHEDFKAVV